MSEGWKCPNCGGAHAPDVKTCPVVTVPSPLGPFPFGPDPTYVSWFEPIRTPPVDDGMCPACRHSGICMCVRPGWRITY